MLKGWKRGAAALLLVLILLAGSWGGLLAAWRSAEGMGKKEDWLPRLVPQGEGGIELTVGGQVWRLQGEKLEHILTVAGGVGWLVPRSLRITALSALTGLFLWEQNTQPTPAKKLV